MKAIALLSILAASAAAVELSTVYQFPNGTWLENIAQMQNGSLLVTMIRRAEVHMVNPTPNTTTANSGNSSSATASLVASFPGHNSVLGITELESDVFAVAVGNVTESNTPVEGTFAVYSIDFTSSSSSSSSCSPSSPSSPSSNPAIKISQVADLPTQGLLNGIAFDPPSTLYLADSWLGNIVALNSSTGNVIETIEHPAFAANFSSPTLVLGVNGLRRSGEWMYFSNTVRNLVGRFELGSINTAHESASETNTAAVHVEIIKQGEDIAQLDDFAVLDDGSVLLARPLADSLMHVGLDGGVSEVARGGEASGGTSVVGGKNRGFYMSTSGLVGGVSSEGGRIVRVGM